MSLLPKAINIVIVEGHLPNEWMIGKREVWE